MNRVKHFIFLALLALPLTACLPENAAPAPTQRDIQTQAAQRAANAVTFTDNAEIDNIRRRIELTANPGLLGFVVLFNESGVPIMQEAVHGKITSSSARLTPPDRTNQISTGGNNGGQHSVVRQAANDTGTWGSSSPYIYYFTQDGQYRQWSGHYLYSTTPIRLRIEPMVVNVVTTPTPTR